MLENIEGKWMLHKMGPLRLKMVFSPVLVSGDKQASPTKCGRQAFTVAWLHSACKHLCKRLSLSRMPVVIHSYVLPLDSLLVVSMMWPNMSWVKQHKCRMFILFRSHLYSHPSLEINIALLDAFGWWKQYKSRQIKKNKGEREISYILIKITTLSPEHRGCWEHRQPFTTSAHILHSAHLLFLSIYFPPPKYRYLYVNWLFIPVRLLCGAVWLSVFYGSENTFIFSNWFISPFSNKTNKRCCSLK